MRVVADSHALIFSLFTPDRLSEPELEALGEAENGTGIVVSAATLGDLWYASHKNGPNSLAPGAFESLRRTVHDPTTNFDVHWDVQRDGRQALCAGLQLLTAP